MPMDPLNGVSTDGGENMRGICARALAAALLTGAIAAVVTVGGVFEPANDTARGVAAPPAALARTVAIRVTLAPPTLRRTAPAEASRPVSRAVSPAAAPRRIVSRTTPTPRPPRRALAS